MKSIKVCVRRRRLDGRNTLVEAQFLFLGNLPRGGRSFKRKNTPTQIPRLKCVRWACVYGQTTHLALRDNTRGPRHVLRGSVSCATF